MHRVSLLWIRIRIKLKGRIRIQVVTWIRISNKCDTLDPDPHQFADDKPKCKEYEPI
jgi:hypothetical protein